MMKWTQEKVEARLLPLLKELGGGPNKVAESLKAKKIKGFQGSIAECPIAVLVKKTFKSATEISVDGESIEVTLGEQTFFVKPPVAVEKFMGKFDEGSYPFLDEDGEIKA